VAGTYVPTKDISSTDQARLVRAFRVITSCLSANRQTVQL